MVDNNRTLNSAIIQPYVGETPRSHSCRDKLHLIDVANMASCVARDAGARQ